MATPTEASVTITTPDAMATEDHDDDDSDLDESIRSSYDKTEFRLGIVGVVFIIAGALFLIVPGTLTKRHRPGEEDPEETHQRSASSSGFFITGGVMFGLGAMMVAINVFWCLNEQRLLRELEKAKEKKAQERYQRSPNCAYHSLPQPSSSSLPVSDGIVCYGDDSADIDPYAETRHDTRDVIASSDNMYTTRYNHNADNDTTAAVRPTTFDNPSYLSDATA